MKISSPLISDERPNWGEREQVQHLVVGIILQAMDDAEKIAHSMTKNELIHNRRKMMDILEFFDKDLEVLLESSRLRVKFVPFYEKMRPCLDKIRSILKSNVVELQQPSESEEIAEASGF